MSVSLLSLPASCPSSAGKLDSLIYFLLNCASSYVADDVFFGSERSKGNDVLSIPEFARERVSQDGLCIV